MSTLVWMPVFLLRDYYTVFRTSKKYFFGENPEKSRSKFFLWGN